jgi:hypothetical protein
VDYHQKFRYITKINPKENPKHSGVLDDDHYLEHGEGENSSLEVIPNINHRTSGMRTSVFQVQEHSIQDVEQEHFLEWVDFVSVTQYYDHIHALENPSMHKCYARDEYTQT